MEQLLMRWDTAELVPFPPTEGYTFVNYRRDGTEQISPERFREGYLRTMAPDRTPADWEFPWFHDDQRIPDDGFFVIVPTGTDQIVATAAIQLHEYKPDSATLHMVYTHPDHRGKGLGAWVTVAAMGYAHAHGLPVMYLTTDEFRIPAIKIYLKYGFRPVLYREDMAGRWQSVMNTLGLGSLEVYDENEMPGVVTL